MITDKRWAVEPLYTDTIVWEVVSQTAKTVTLRWARQGEIVRREGEGFPVIWRSAVSDPHGRTVTVRLRKDGSVRIGGGRPLRFTDEPVFRTDYSF